MGIATVQKVYIMGAPLEKAVPANYPSRYPAWPGIVFLFVVLPLLLLPEMARREVVRHLEARVNAPVAIGDVDLNPFTGRTKIKNLVIGGDGGTEPILRVPVLDFSLDRDALFRRDVIIHRVTAYNLALHLERTGPTRWNIDRLLQSRWEGGPGLGAFTLGQVHVKDGSITVADRTTTPAVKNVLEHVDLTLQPVPLTPEAEAGQVAGEARLGKGSVQISGTLHLNPFTGRLHLTAARVPVAGFQGYVNELVGRGESFGGTLDGRLEVAAALDAKGYLTLDMQGGFEGHGIEFAIPGDEKPFFHATRLSAEKAQVRLMPTLKVEIPKVEVTGATIRVTRDGHGKFNVRRLWDDALVARPAGRSTPRQPSAAEPPLTFRHLSLRDSRIEFVDATLTPTFTGIMSNMTAEVANAYPKKDRATVRLTGTLAGSAPLALTGWFTPVGRPPKVYMEGTVRDFELSRMNPYAEKYIRHAVRRGRVTTDLQYTYDAGNLDAGNEIRIRQIKVGDPLGEEFEAEVGIPLKLALALLEGLDGEIHIRVPVQGHLDNPEMRIDNVVWEAVRNAVMKAITAPFQLFGKIVKAGGKIISVQIDPIGFLPGSATPTAEGKARLEQLVPYLRKRPRLDLQIEGQASRAEAKALSHERRDGRVATDQELRKLAEDRARFIERTLVGRGIAQKRLFVLTGEPNAVRDRGAGQVEFRMLD